MSSPEPMIAARAKTNDAKRLAVLNVIRSLQDAQDLASLGNDSEIARRAGVHRNYVANFRGEVEVAKAEINRRFLSGATGKANLGAASLRAEHQLLKEQFRQQSDELARLRRRLSVELGAEVASERFEANRTPEAAALIRENEQLATRTVELEMALRMAEEELEAARRTNRQMMRERNRGATE
jgi:hypothetical protein